LKRRREKNLNGGFRFGLVSVLPGEETSGAGAGGDMPAEKRGKIKLFLVSEFFPKEGFLEFNGET